MEYLINRDKVRQFLCSAYELDGLKVKYKEVIASTREYEKIKTLDQFIGVLERRYEVSPEDMSLFNDIADTLGQTLHETINNHAISDPREELSVINTEQGS